MALRLLEIVVPEEATPDVLKIIEEGQITNFWQTCSCESRNIFKMIIAAEKTEKLLDTLQKKYGHLDSFHMVLLPLEASYPGTKEIEATAEEKEKVETEKKEPLRVSRQELYNDVFYSAKLTRTYMIMIVLSTIVAAIGLVKDNVAVIIGAMVIAPLLGPNVALSFATTVGDGALGRNALLTNFAGILTAFAVSLLFGFFLAIDPGIREIAARTVVSYGDIALALASGVAAALSITSGVPSVLIGVMVSVALIPPLVVFGLLLGSANFMLALQALQLVFINMICINLAGVFTFLLQGVRPLNWWEASKAKNATRYAIIIWVSLLILLSALLMFSRP
ncbi:MAG: TIGR00341 family protein [Deltaproteobacteria bacterium]|nr:TIGR00341 family protein [Deltaproteobacteria bacterium]